MIHELPEPGLSRWQPLRAGLVDLFYYDTEEFWFRDGRLLLRGNNGTGKSKVLALMLPFLLDGDLSSHRVEPDADPRKKMEWNLLLGGEHPFPERLGYTWLEFGRVDEHGGAHFRTLGCGLKAVSGRGIARHWFFITDRRVGADLILVDATGTALSRDRLGESLGERGTLYDRARSYRRAIDETFFGIGEQRYGALVDLLVQLRQPQLSKRPSERALSAALTEALPPLDQAVIADVADAFRSLEEDRDSVKALREAHAAADSFLGHYRRYARIATRRRAALPRNAQSTYERINRELQASEADYAKAVAELSAATETLAGLRAAGERLRAKERALHDGPEMRSARELEHMAEQVRRLRAEATRLGAEHDTAAGRVQGRRRRHEVATERASSGREQLAESRLSARDCAAAARIVAEHSERIDAVVAALPDTHELRRLSDQLADRQQCAIDHVRTLIATVDDAARSVADARRTMGDLDTEAAQLANRRRDAADRVTALAAELVSAVREQLARATELRLPDMAATLAELELWVETLDGPNPVTAVVSVSGQAAAAELARSDAALGSRQLAGRDRAAELTGEIERLERGEHTAPPGRHTTDVAARADRPGAPLWRLVDFAAAVTPLERAGLEAALEAAGILDAWVTPDGRLLAADTDDVVVRPGTRARTGLETVLRSAPDREDPHAGAVSDEVVTAVLAAIGLGEDGETWIATDGRFRIGVLEGAWHKPVATFIGSGAREAARRIRLTELRADLTTVQSELADIAAARADLADRMTALTAEVAGVPGDSAVRQAHAQVLSLVGEHERLTARRDKAAAAVVATTAMHEGARAALDEGAHDAGLPGDRAALDEVDQALHRYRVTVTGLWHASEALTDAVRRVEEAAAALAEAEADLSALAQRRAGADRDSDAAAERHRTLLSTVGATVAELHRQLAEVADLLLTNDTDRAGAGDERDNAIAARGRAEGRREELSAMLADATAERSAAAEAFKRFVATGLLAIALPELAVPDIRDDWAPDPTVRLARRVNDELGDVPEDDQAWDRTQQRLNTELKVLTDKLSAQGNRVSADLHEDGVVVELEFRGRLTSVSDLTGALEVEVADRDRLLNEREREILENHLINEVASTLQELMAAAETQVAGMNAELAQRPTSTGMRLRLSWCPREDGPAGLAAARQRLLRQTADAWSAEDRAAVGGFLQSRIADVRARDETGTWLEQLTEALDYRTWNRFAIERRQNGQWKAAAGPASGGERVLAASVPLFAAASSHYASAGNPHSPRLVTLDEAFAGVDDNARAKYLGLLAAFDLDVVMTSEREWGCYPEVPGLAISHLSRSEGVPAVLVTNWEWDGVRRTTVDRPRPVDDERPPPGDTLQDALG